MYFECLGATENRRDWRLAAVEPDNLQYRRWTPEGAIDYEFLKKKPATLSKWEIIPMSPVKFHPPKRCQRSPESLAGLIDRSLPLYEDGDVAVFSNA